MGQGSRDCHSADLRLLYIFGTPCTLPAPPPAGSLNPVCGRNIFIVNSEALSQAAQTSRVVLSWCEVVW